MFALVVLYFIHSLVFLFLPRLNPALASEIDIKLAARFAAGRGDRLDCGDGRDDLYSIAPGRWRFAHDRVLVNGSASIR